MPRDTSPLPWQQPWECFPAIIRATIPPLVVVGVVAYAIRLAELGYSLEAISGAVAALVAAVVYAVDRLLRQRPRSRPRRR